MVKKKNDKLLLVTIGALFGILISLGLYIIIVFHNPFEPEIIMPKLNSEGKVVIIERVTLEKLNKLFVESKKEYFLCLIGKETEKTFQINGFVNIELKFANETHAETGEDNACEDISNNFGSLHNHKQELIGTKVKRLCDPSNQDIWTFGSMANKINAIQCGEGVERIAFYDNPTPQEPMDLGRLPIEVR